MAYNKLVLLHQYISKETQLTESFKDDSKIIQTDNNTNLENILGQIQELKNSDGKYPFNHLAFVYHYPGYCRVPFLKSFKRDPSGNLIRDKYRYFNDEIIDLIKEIGSGLTVDLLSCDLKDDKFKEEVAKIESDLNINIRYSVDQTGNNPQGNWVLESDDVNIKDLYFSETIDQWSGVLNGGRTASQVATALPDYFSWDGTTLKLLQDMSWSTFQGVSSVWQDYHIRLGTNEVFDGQGYTIDVSGNSSFEGIFSTDGTDIDNASVIRNLGVLGTISIQFESYIVKDVQSYFKISNCYCTGNIITNYTGGICGMQPGDGGACIISNCYCTGNISAAFAGGICGGGAGYNEGICTITNCYSTGNISGFGSGGICGAGAGAGGTCNISNCYSTGSIGGSDAGGICGSGAGDENGTCTVTDCYSELVTNVNIQGGNSDGTKPMDGNNNITNLTTTSKGSLGDQYTLSFLNNYTYPVLKSNLGAGSITSTDTTITLNRRINFSILQNALNHNTTTNFTHFTGTRTIDNNNNYIILNNKTNTDILDYKNILNVGNLRSIGYTANELNDLNFTVGDLKYNYTPTELKNGNYSVNDLKGGNLFNYKIYQAGYTSANILAGLSGIAIVNELKKMRANNYSVADIENNKSGVSISEQDYLDAGYPESQILEAGLTLP
jgi:hypothetical protein